LHHAIPDSINPAACEHRGLPRNERCTFHCFDLFISASENRASVFLLNRSGPVIICITMRSDEAPPDTIFLMRLKWRAAGNLCFSAKDRFPCLSGAGLQPSFCFLIHVLGLSPQAGMRARLRRLT
jgi:hypothetical protein